MPKYSLQSNTERIPKSDYDKRQEELRKQGWSISRTTPTEDDQVEIVTERWGVDVPDTLSSPAAAETQAEQIAREQQAQENL